MTMMEYAVIFPGQGAQSVGMGLDLWQQNAAAKEVFDQADAILGFGLSKLCFEGPEDELKRTENAQPAILMVSIAAYRALASQVELSPKYVAGHSLGEYSALVASGVLDLHDALRLVRKRGQLMAAAQPPGEGSMLAVLGLDQKWIGAVIGQASSMGVVEIANLNCPGQIVLTGQIGALAEAGRLASAAGASRVIELQVSGAFHSSLMRPMATEFAAVLATAEIRPARIPIVANVTARETAEPQEIRRLLAEQIYSSVRWEDSVRLMAGNGAGLFVECGPGKVLSGLVKRVDQKLKTANVNDVNTLKETLAFFGEV